MATIVTIVVPAAFLVPVVLLALVDVPTSAHVFVCLLGVSVVLAATRSRSVLASSLSTHVGAFAALTGLSFAAFGALIPIELRLLGPVTLLVSLPLLVVLEAATGLVAYPMSVDVATVAGVSPSVRLALLAALPSVLLVELGVVLSLLRTTVVTALESLLAPTALADIRTLPAVTPLRLRRTAIAAISPVLRRLLALQLRLTARQPFLASAVLSRLLLTAALLARSRLTIPLLALVLLTVVLLAALRSRAPFGLFLAELGLVAPSPFLSPRLTAVLEVRLVADVGFELAARTGLALAAGPAALAASTLHAALLTVLVLLIALALLSVLVLPALLALLSALLAGALLALAGHSVLFSLSVLPATRLSILLLALLSALPSSLLFVLPTSVLVNLFAPCLAAVLERALLERVGFEAAVLAASL